VKLSYRRVRSIGMLAVLDPCSLPIMSGRGMDGGGNDLGQLWNNEGATMNNWVLVLYVITVMNQHGYRSTFYYADPPVAFTSQMECEAELKKRRDFTTRSVLRSAPTWAPSAFSTSVVTAPKSNRPRA
jgi:hypothetical protein